MSDKVCQLCGGKLAVWNRSLGSDQCDACSKGRSPEAKRLREIKLSTKECLHDIAIAQKIAMGAVLVAFLVVGGTVFLRVRGHDPRLLLIGGGVFVCWAVFRLANALESPSALTWAVIAFFCGGGVVFLAVFTHRASKALKVVGLHPGLLGVRLKDIESLELQSHRDPWRLENELSRLATSKASGEISDEEYQQKKSEVLGW